MNTTVSAMDARKRFGEILNSAFYHGISTTIQRKGKAIAKIVPVMDERVVPRRNIEEYAGIWKDNADVEIMKRDVAHARRSLMRKSNPL